MALMLLSYRSHCLPIDGPCPSYLQVKMDVDKAACNKCTLHSVSDMEKRLMWEQMMVNGVGG
jgi:hypothetical protein